MVRIRFVDLQLTFILIDAREHRGFAREHRRVIDEELGAKIVAAIDDEVVARDEVDRVVGIEPYRVGFNAKAAIEKLNPTVRVERLTVQIARIEHIGIDDADAADTRAREILQNWAAESAGANDEHAAHRESFLAFDPDFLQ